MGKPISFKWKLVLAGIALSLAFLGWIFTEGAHRWVVDQMNMAFKDMTPDEQRESAWAARWQQWAYFRGSVCGEYKEGCSMYREFCGMPKDYNLRLWDIVRSPQFKNKFVGKCTVDGTKGWGPMHPDAPDAYYEYLSMMEPNESGATTGNEAKVYFVLFYTWYSKHSPDKKPHPKFNKYWAKIRQKILNGHTAMDDIPNFDFQAKNALPWKDESGETQTAAK